MTGVADEFVSAYNERDWERMRGLLAAGCVYEQVGRPKRVAEGADRVIEVFQAWAGAVPEARGTITARIEGEGGVAIELDLEGSVRPPFGDFAPSGKPPVARAALMFHLDGDGRITELRNYYDSLVLYQVLGIEA